MTSIGRVFPPAVVLEMDCRNSHPIDGVKCTRVGPTLPAGEFLREGRPWTNPEQDMVLAQGRSSGECQRLKSDINLSLSVWHSTSITNFSLRELIEWSFQLNDIKFNRLDSSWIIYLLLWVWCGRNLRVHLSIGCPRYSCYCSLFPSQDPKTLYQQALRPRIRWGLPQPVKIRW